jgi:LAS superfamily LD-carboxypeptidase LdcB
MSTRRASITITVTLALTLLSISASGQSASTQTGNSDKPTVATQGPRPVNQENKVADDPLKPNDLESKVAAVKAENEAFRESLRKMEEQQKALLEMVDRLQR